MASSDPFADVADITVVMPAMNRGHLIRPALESVLAQSVQPRQTIVIDDASSDDTAEVARSLGVTVISNPTNLGSGPSRNLGIEAADTEWIAFLDSDDRWSANHLANIVPHLGNRALVSAPGTTSDGARLGNPHDRNHRLTPRAVLFFSDLIITSGTVVRRDVAISAGLFRPLRRAQDLDLWLRILARGPGLGLAESTVTYVLHPEQASLDSDITRVCFDQIVDSSSQMEWFRRHDRDRAYARLHWDSFRIHQRNRDRMGIAELRWLFRRPQTWSTLAQMLHLRRVRRATTHADSFSAPVGRH